MENKNENSKTQSFGGSEARIKYENKRALSDKMLIGILSFVVAIIAVLAMIGIISLANGSLFGNKNNSENGGNSSINVPTKSEIGEINGAEENIKNARKTTVVLKIDTADGQTLRQSGFLISGDGYIVTQYRDAFEQNCSYTAFIGETDSYSASLSGTIKHLGLAYMHLAGYDINSEVNSDDIVFGNSSFVNIGETVWAVPGEHSDFSAYAMHGIVSGVNKTSLITDDSSSKYFTLVYVDFKINDSISGAPLINANGEIVGLCTTSIDAPSDDIGVIVPINTVVLLGNDMINNYN